MPVRYLDPTNDVTFFVYRTSVLRIRTFLFNYDINMKYYSWLVLLIWLVINHYQAVYADDKNVKSSPKISYLQKAEVDRQSKKSNFIAKIAVIDIQFVLDNSVAIHSVRESIDNINKQIQQDLLEKEKELAKTEQLLLAERDSLSESDFEQKVNDFNQKVSIVQKDVQDKKRHLENAHAEAIGKVQEATTKIISELAGKYNIDLVIHNNQVLFARNTLNITSEVIIELNDKLKHVIVDLEEFNVRKN